MALLTSEIQTKLVGLLVDEGLVSAAVIQDAKSASTKSGSYSIQSTPNADEPPV